MVEVRVKANIPAMLDNCADRDVFLPEIIFGLAGAYQHNPCVNRLCRHGSFPTLLTIPHPFSNIGGFGEFSRNCYASNQSAVLQRNAVHRLLIPSRGID
jgi:hypothetical protein